MADKNDRRRRTPWFPRDIKPAHQGEYECAVKISSSVPALLWRLKWDGIGFLVPFPMVVLSWRGLVKRPPGVATDQSNGGE